MDVMRRRRALRCGMALVALLLIVVIALTTALFAYRYVAVSRKPVPQMTRSCVVKYHESPNAVAGNSGSGSFEEDLEIGEGAGTYEKLKVPSILEYLPSTVLHDFYVNLTAIIYRDQGRCYVLPLRVQPPTNLFELLVNLQNYVPDVELVRETYRALLPEIKDLSQFGHNIQRECQRYHTFRLVQSLGNDALDHSQKTKRHAECEMLGEKFCMGHSVGSFVMPCFTLTGCV